MAEEAQGPRPRRAQGGQPRADRGARRLRRHLGRRAVGAAGHRSTRGHYSTLLGTTYENDPVLGIVSRARPARARVADGRCAYYVGVLAATILFIATNAGLIGISRLSWSLAEHRQLPRDLRAAAPALPHAVVHDRLLLGARGAAAPPGRDRLPRQPLLVRRDAVVHDRARRGRSRCASRSPTASAPTGCRGTCASAARPVPLTAVLGGDRHVRRLGARSSCCTPRRARSASAWMVVGMARLLRLPPPPGPRPAHRVQDRARHARPPDFERARLPLRARADLRRRRERARAAQPPRSWSASDAIVDAVYVLRGAAASSRSTAGLEDEEDARPHACSRARASRRAGSGLKVRTGADPHAPAPARRSSRRRGGVGSEVDLPGRRSTRRPPSSPLGPTAPYLLAKRPCRVIVASAPAAAPNGEAPEASRRVRARP